MTTHPGGHPSPTRPERTFRTLPARVVGWGMVGLATLLVALTVQDALAGRIHGLTELIAPLALMVGLAVVGWVLFLRPCVRVFTDRVELRNVLRDVTVPYARVAELTDRWSFGVVDTDGREHLAWASPTRRQARPTTSVDDFGASTRRRGSEGASATGVADLAQRMLYRWRLDGGERRTGEAVPVRSRLSVPAVAALGVLAALVVLAFLT